MLVTLNVANSGSGGAQGFARGFARRQVGIEDMHELAGDVGVDSPAAGDYVGNARGYERAGQAVSVGGGAFVSVGGVTGGENCQLQIVQSERRDVLRTQQRSRAEDQADMVEAGSRMAGEVQHASVAQLCEDFGAGYFLPVDQDCVVEERGYFGAFLIGSRQYGQGGIGCAGGYDHEGGALGRE